MQVKLGIIAPYEGLAHLCSEVCTELSEHAEICVGDLAIGVEIAREMERLGVDAIISRGGTALAIQRAVEIPVVSIEVSPLDIMKAVIEARQLGQVIGVVGFTNVIYSIEEISEILNTTLIPIEIQSEVEAEARIYSAVQEGVEVVVGDAISTKTTSTFGARSVLIQSGKEAIGRAITEAKHVAAVRQRERQRAQELRAILDFAHEGIIGVGPDGLIRFFNPISERVLGISAKEATGRHISDMVPGLSFERLVASGEAEVGELSKIGSKVVVSTRVPIKVNTKVTGAVVTFQDVTRIQKLEEKVRKELRSKGHIAKYTFDDIKTVSESVQALIARARKYARADSTVLITGETGTGKELFAQSIHNESPRRDFPFVAINCAALPEALLESELFGYEEGAFTGARRGGKRGLFEQAHRGTIFLDEIGEMPVRVQSRLLRVLEEREVMRVGGDGVIPVDVRVIAATNVDLRQAIADERFREDLYYRLNTLALHIPPLRQRPADVSAFAEEFLMSYCDKSGQPRKCLMEDAIRVFESHTWPGNVRELKNVIERIVIGTDSSVVCAKEVSAMIHYDDDSYSEPLPAVCEAQSNFKGNMLGDLELQAIRNALEAAGGNRTRAAEVLGISRTTLWRKLRKHES